MRRFDGWLGLLCVLADALDAQPPAAVTGGLGAELASGRDPDLGQRM